MLEKPPHIKISYPSIPTEDFKWESGSDVQTLWRKHGWTPPSENMTPPPPPTKTLEEYKAPLRRVR
jgi:hypothetical protein